MPSRSSDEPDVHRRALIAGLSAVPLFPAYGAPSAPAPWTKLSTEAYDGKQDDISFVDDQNGWYGNGAGRLYRTTDGGSTWTRVAERKGTFIRSVGFLDRNRGFIGNVGVDYYPEVTDRIPLYKTDDGGVTWSPVSPPGIDLVAGVCGIDILPVRRIYQGAMRTTYLLHAAGRVGGPTAILRSVDEGETWSVHDMRRWAGMILDVKFLTPNIGFVAASAPDPDGGGEALILRTTDGSRSWQTVYKSGRRNENVWKMSWPSPLVGYGTVQSYDDGNDQRVFVKTIDGGRSWHERPLVRKKGAQEFGVGFVSQSYGWIGCRDALYETQDGGEHWQAADAGQAVNKIRIVKSGRGLRVFAIGRNLHRLDIPA